jgi:hypothetical protein
MIKEALDLLHKLDYYNGTDTIEIAKGRHEYVTLWSESKEKLKRAWRLKK